MRPATKDEGDPDFCVLEVIKLQYGALAPDMMLRFENGVFHTTGRRRVNQSADCRRGVPDFLDLSLGQAATSATKKARRLPQHCLAKEKETTFLKLDKAP